MTVEELVKVLEMQEEILQFSSFTNADAWELGNMVIQEAKRLGLTVAVRIRLNNGYTVFQYGMDGTNLLNEQWMTRKENTVKTLEESSFMISAAEMLLRSTIHFNEKTCMLLILSMTLTPTCTVRFFAGMSIGTKLSSVLSAPPKITGKSPSLTSRSDLNSGLAGVSFDAVCEGLNMLRTEFLFGSFSLEGKV